MGDVFEKILDPFDVLDNMFPGIWGGGGDGSEEAAAEETSVATPSVEEQAAQRRLARLSKYFTTPTGVMDEPTTGSTGVFG